MHITTSGSQTQGSNPYLETNFQDFSRIQIDFSRTLKFHSQDLQVNSPYCLPYISYLLLEFNRFSELSKISSLFPGLSGPGKCHNKMPGLSRFCRTHMKPADKKAWKQKKHEGLYNPLTGNHTNSYASHLQWCETLQLSQMRTITVGQQHVYLEIKFFPSLVLPSILASRLLEQMIHLLSLEPFWSPHLIKGIHLL